MDRKMEAIMATTRDMHLFLSDDLIDGLERAATELGRRRVDLVREAIADYLKRLEAQRIEREMADYVDAMATWSDEFVRETDKHARARLLKETTW